MSVAAFAVSGVLLKVVAPCLYGLFIHTEVSGVSISFTFCGDVEF